MDQGMHIGTTTLYQYMQWATYQTVKHWSLVLISNYKLEYLAVYGHASSEQCARGVSALNTWSKVWPSILIWAYLIWNFEPIFGQQISILDPPPLTLDFLVRLGLNFHSGWFAGEGRFGRRQFFCHGQKGDYLSRASQRVRGATKNVKTFLHLYGLTLYTVSYRRTSTVQCRCHVRGVLFFVQERTCKRCVSDGSAAMVAFLHDDDNQCSYTQVTG